MAYQNPIDDILYAMTVYGGSFIERLAACYRSADPANRARLEAAFPDQFARYDLLATAARDKAGR